MTVKELVDWLASKSPDALVEYCVMNQMDGWWRGINTLHLRVANVESIHIPEEEN